MFDRSFVEKQILTPNEISRRALLRTGGLALAAAAVPSTIRELAETTGALYDTIASPEDLVPRPVTTLEPRPDDTPTVSPQPRAGAIDIQTHYAASGKTATLRLPTDAPLNAEHTGAHVDTTDLFTSAGAGIITTAEGLELGEQAYCAFFTSKDRVIAVGYEGGLYTYEPMLGQAKNGTTGEWTRIVTQKPESTLPSQVFTTTPWEKLKSVSPNDMLIQDVVQGTETLRSLGYKPFSAILPSTKMPSMKRCDIGPESCAQDAKELLEHGKRYFITENGETVDLDHLQAKAGQTLSLFAQLKYQQITGEKQPVARVAYAGNGGAAYEFSVHPDSLQPDTLPDTTFALMNAVTTLMEGVSQRYATEKVPLTARWSASSGMSHEDMFTNSLGITGMLTLIHEYQLAEKLTEPLQRIYRNNPNVPAQDVLTAIDRVIDDIKPQLMQLVVAQVAHTHGIRNQKVRLTGEMPRGIYHLIPTKVHDADASTPTRINLEAAGIKVNNPNVRFRPTNVPVMETTVGHLLSKAGL